jgi:hypothetical protein
MPGPRAESKLAPTSPVLATVAFHGILGEIVAEVRASTEGDPAGILASLICGAGVLMNATPHLQIGGTKHPLLVWPLLFGRTGSGRKGEATNVAEQFLTRAHRDFVKIRTTGLSSGEGLIEAIRDLTEVKHGRDVEVIGTTDKRLFLVEPEFSSVMARAKREGSTLAAVLRQAWDGRALSVLNRSALRASSSHVGVIGHVAPAEFCKRLAEAEMSGGLYNRFLPVWTERPHLLPIPPELDPKTVEALAKDLARGIARAPKLSVMRLAPGQAVDLWTEELYPRFAGMDDSDEVWAEFSRRAAPYCLRVAAIYAVLAGANTITLPALTAAAAMIEYSTRTARYVLGDQSKDPRLDRIKRAVDARETGLTRTEISDLFGRNLSAAVLGELIAVLTSQGYEEVPLPGGRGRNPVVLRRTKETKETKL